MRTCSLSKWNDECRAGSVGLLQVIPVMSEELDVADILEAAAATKAATTEDLVFILKVCLVISTRKALF